MKLFALTLFAAVAIAAEAETEAKTETKVEAKAEAQVEGIISEHQKLNQNYDNVDPDHHYFGTGHPASPAYPTVPKLEMAVDYFDPEGTLFGEHRYQMQVAKTGNMLVGTEALRESITRLRDRLEKARFQLKENDTRIQVNADHNSQVGFLIGKNRDELNSLDTQIGNLEDGYYKLHHEMAIDREAIIMMCHQYAYATTIPDECQPFLGFLASPVQFAW